MITFNKMPVRPDAKEVLIRIGAYKCVSDRLLCTARRALDGLYPDGRCDIVDVVYTDSGVNIGEYSLDSMALADYMKGSSKALIMVSTLGASVMNRIAEMSERGCMDKAVWLDAAASIAVDCGLDFMTAQMAARIRRFGLTPNKRRFSPGYGDLSLSAQKIFYSLLDAHELGLALTDSYMLVPEKSVMAICGLV